MKTNPEILIISWRNKFNIDYSINKEDVFY